MEKILVTGASGYIGLHVIAQLIDRGYLVKGSLRSRDRESEVRNALSKVVNTENKLEICELDLLKDDGWDDAAQGCEYVIHVASPLVQKAPDDENQVIEPAKQGLIRALESSIKNKVKRFVMTSSFSAVGYGHDKDVFDESHWTNPKKNIGAYNKSKAIAEKTMWDHLQHLVLAQLAVTGLHSKTKRDTSMPIFWRFLLSWEQFLDDFFVEGAMLKAIFWIQE